MKPTKYRLQFPPFAPAPSKSLYLICKFTIFEKKFPQTIEALDLTKPMSAPEYMLSRKLRNNPEISSLAKWRQSVAYN